MVDEKQPNYPMTEGLRGCYELFLRKPELILRLNVEGHKDSAAH